METVLRGLGPRARFELPLPDGRRLNLGTRTLVMGILNVTPDSFADGGRFPDAGVAGAAALEMEAAGADIIDLGGESTRPGAEALPAAEELSRVIPVLEGMAGRITVPVSIDTQKAVVAEAALARGATIVNDVSGLRADPGMASVAARHGAGLILMHNRGRSRDMYAGASYADVVGEVMRELAGMVEAAAAAGVDPQRVVVDPGIGFGKRAEHSYAVLAGLPRLAALGHPLLVGVSQKSFLKAALGDRPPDGRRWGTAAAVAAAVLQGAHIVRVHAVADMVDVVRVADRIRAAAGSG